WVRTPIDAFILARLEAKGLRPAPEADRRTLIRRAYYDLLGLPPTPEEVEGFVRDRAAGAWERVVDRLLASPHYGERWARHWLDVARYADSNGLDENTAFGNAWRYRDYVIRAFNQDKPYDQFLREQIAGDLMPTEDENLRNERLTATGFLVLGAKVLAEPDKEKMVMDIVDEQIEVVTKTVMGLTVACARCHDHKFDPITTQDYYALAGIFKSTRTMATLATVARILERPLMTRELEAQVQKHQEQMARLQREVEKARAQANQTVLAGMRRDAGKYLRAGWELLQQPGESALQQIARRENLIPEVIRRWADALSRGEEHPVLLPFVRIARQLAAQGNTPVTLDLPPGTVVDPAVENALRGVRLQSLDVLVQRYEALFHAAHSERPEKHSLHRMLYGPEGLLALPKKPEEFYTPEERDAVHRAEQAVKELQKAAPVIPMTPAVEEAQKIGNCRVHIRGSTLTLGEEVPRRFLTVLGDTRTRPVNERQSGRLELAEWLTRPDHPLTARVAVNRIWQHHFGQGLVRTPDNWGFLGERPTHPELLDWLAAVFVEKPGTGSASPYACGWSLKKMHRLIMLSSTYRMSSTYNPQGALKDPDNRLWWRFNRRRLEAEPFRDAILAVAGRLDRTMGGSLLTTPNFEYVTNDQSANAAQYNHPRRSIYLPVIRNAVYDVFQAFDFGDPTMVNAQRASTTVAPQALIVMNSPFVLEQAKAWAGNLLQMTDRDDAGRIHFAYLQAFARPPGKAELQRALAYLARYEAQIAPTEADPSRRRLRAWSSLCHVLLASNEFIYLN
ncbi:MAG: DUF1549 and DUF1553 domain-containing protein, partial [Chthonomonadaceae bacterium]|nr:DUF1549 and DUF1553 domain-containing protein [Chthonomonadaceae bacterium]